MNATKKISIFLGVTAVIAIVYFVYKYMKAHNIIGSDKLGINTDSPINIIDYGDSVNTNKLLSLGEKSNNVLRLQSFINDTISKSGLSISQLSLDGVYGQKTEDAVKYLSKGNLKSGTVTVNKLANVSFTVPQIPLASQPVINPSVLTGTGYKTNSDIVKLYSTNY